jgi:hypothetical protein
VLDSLRTGAEHLPKIEAAPRRVFRYLTVPKDDRERPFLARELVRCGKPRCRCAHGLKHGPYFYLRYEEYDHASGGSHFRREYVPRSEVSRVRRWIRRDRGEVASGRAFMGWLRRGAEAELRAERRAQPRSRHRPTSRGADVQTITPTAVVPTSPAPPLHRAALVNVVWAPAPSPGNRLETGSGNPSGVGGLAPTLPPPAPVRRSAFHHEMEERFDRPRPTPKVAASYAVRREGR